MIVVIDYGRGNLFSIGQALAQLRAAYKVTDRPAEIATAERLVLPGVGSFGDAMAGLRNSGLIEPLRERVNDGAPLLGICVGCQLLLSHGEEFGRHDGLGLIPGTVRRIPPRRDGEPDAVRVPNVGWRRVETRHRHPLFSPADPTRDASFYFVHSYAPYPLEQPDVLAVCHLNGEPVPVAVGHKNVVGVQFHPEKSAAAGLRLLQRFLTFNPD